MTIASLSDVELKPWRTAQAQCLLAGFSANLIDSDDGRPLLVVSRWAMTKTFDSTPAVDQWLTRVVGKAT